MIALPLPDASPDLFRLFLDSSLHLYSTYNYENIITYAHFQQNTIISRHFVWHFRR